MALADPNTSGEADIRGININKLATGFADEANVFKKFVINSKTQARELRWYQKESGFLGSVTTSGITKDLIFQNDQGALPSVVEQSWDRQTSYIKKFFVESPTITMEDIKDSDIDIFGTNVQDLVRAVDRKVDLRIFSILVEADAATPTTPNPSTTHNSAATADGWDDVETGNPIADILLMKQTIRSSGYNIKGAVLAMNPIEERYLMNFLISVKGSSIPQYASEKVASGVVTEILGVGILVSENWTTDSVGMWLPDKTIRYKQFMPLTTAVIDNPGIGKKIRIWEEGEAILENPASAYILTATSAA